MRDFFETRIGSEIVNIVTAVGEASEFPFDVAEIGMSDYDAFKAGIDDGVWGQWRPPEKSRDFWGVPILGTGPRI